MYELENYMNSLDLFDYARLKQHAEHNLVYFIESPRFPDLVMLHYKEEAHFDKKWTTFSRMCRGAIVDLKNKRVIAYPYEKFFNLGEMLETTYENLLHEGEFEVSEKLDGSMLILFKDPTTGQFYFTTKGSFDSEHGVYATQIMPDSLKDDKLVEDWTLVFELIANKFRIVVDYTKKGYPEGVYLVGARNKRTGKMLSYKEVQEFAGLLNVPTLKTYKVESLEALIETAKNLPVLEEGFVLRFKEGLLVKLKGMAYLKAHRFISKLSDRSLLEATAEGLDKQMIELAPEEYRDDVIAKITYYKNRKREIIDYVYHHFAYLPKGSRKEFALAIKQSPSIEPKYAPFLFNILDGKPIDEKRVYKLLADTEQISAETKI